MLDHKNKELNKAVLGTGDLCSVRCQVYPPVLDRAIPNRRYQMKLSKPCFSCNINKVLRILGLASYGLL